MTAPKHIKKPLTTEQREARRLYHLAYRAANREKYRAYDAARPVEKLEKKRARRAALYAANREEICVEHRAWYAAHREEARRRWATYHAAHVEEKRAYDAQYQAAHPEQAAANNAKHRAAKCNAPVNDFTADQWREMQAAYDHRCAYCQKRAKGHLTHDHLTPLAKGGSHTLHNILPACRNCNSRKGTRGVLVPVQPLFLSLALAKK